MLDYDSFVATEAIYKITDLRSLFSKEINIRRYMLVLGGTGQIKLFDCVYQLRSAALRHRAMDFNSRTDSASFPQLMIFFITHLEQSDESDENLELLILSQNSLSENKLENEVTFVTTTNNNTTWPGHLPQE